MRTVTFLCILLHGAALAAAELHVEAPLVQVVHSRDKLRIWCRVEGHYDACTTIIGFRLEATCVEKPDAWVMTASAKYRPWIFLQNLSRLSHEHEHLEDVSESVDSYLSGLEGLRFGTKQACQARVLDETTAFGTAMREFAIRSNLQRHPRLAFRH